MGTAAVIFISMLAACSAFQLPMSVVNAPQPLQQRRIYLSEPTPDDAPTPASFSFESGERVEGNNDLNAKTMAADLKEGIAALPPVAYVIGGVGFLGFVYLVVTLLFG